ncbi:MAG: FMN-binding protein [Bacteroidota bacterium]
MNLLFKTFFLSVFIIVLSSFTLDNKADKKLRKDIENSFGISDIEFLPVENVDAPEGDNVYTVSDNNEIYGYAYLGQADSRSEKIDYSILFDKNSNIIKVNVIRYRENYGGEVGSKRWLKQFIGKTNGEDMTFRNDISAISGATISARSMTKSIGEASKLVSSLNADTNE